MAKLDTWCDAATTDVGVHKLYAITGKANHLPIGRDAIAAIMPDHYVTAHELVHVLNRRGKVKSAGLIEQRLPQTTRLRSGDLGEILGTAFVNELTDFRIGVNRLQWRDHRNMAMRGDDLIGFFVDANELKFLKGEAKSGANMTAATLTKARAGLSTFDERPSPHALLFLAEKYLAAGDEDLSDRITDAALDNDIKLEQVTHLMFTLTGNDVTGLLTTELQGYAGDVGQIAVNFHLPTHQAFIAEVYATVIANARQP
ncbi:MAG: DUF1837 domain-containing protein [Brevundimonas sp.]|nr:MAG: DUF1837 domain-containing protein [Brevundimonas sp.]